MRDHELRPRKEMPCNTLKQKDAERADLQARLDEWLGQGNEVKVMPPCATLEAIKEMTGRERMNMRAWHHVWWEWSPVFGKGS